MRDNNLVTLAIHTYEKAIILKNTLEKEGIRVVVGNVNRQQPLISSGVRVCVSEQDLPKALHVVDTLPDSSLLKETINQSPIVLIPIDFSEYSMKACRVGFDYACKHHFKVVLLHAFISHGYSGSLQIDEDGKNQKLFDYFKVKKERSRQMMTEFRSLIQKNIDEGNLPKVSYECELLEGIPETVILEYEKEVNPTLIVMGTRGKHKKEQDLIGSVTAEVLDSSKSPLLVIPEGIIFSNVGTVRRAVFYCNLEQQDLLSLDIFIRDFIDCDVDLYLIHVPTRREKLVFERMDSLEKYCAHQYPWINFRSKLFSEDNFLSDFDSYLKENNIELFVIPNKKRNIFSRLFNPSLAHRIFFHSDMPMLVVPVR